MGGKVQYAVSGGAPLGTRLGHFFRGIGVTILEGYGLTETTAPICVNLPGALKIGTVGPPLPGTTIRIADDGEILAQGVNVFGTYRNNADATTEAIRDGWFHTGDIGELDEDGYLRITGRKKEILVTAGGKNVAPAVLEDRLRAHPLVSQCIVVGDQKPFIAALLTLDEEMLPMWAANHGLEGITPARARTDETRPRRAPEGRRRRQLRRVQGRVDPQVRRPRERLHRGVGSPDARRSSSSATSSCATTRTRSMRSTAADPTHLPPEPPPRPRMPRARSRWAGSPTSACSSGASSGSACRSCSPSRCARSGSGWWLARRTRIGTAPAWLVPAVLVASVAITWAVPLFSYLRGGCADRGARDPGRRRGGWRGAAVAADGGTGADGIRAGGPRARRDRRRSRRSATPHRGSTSG